MSWHPYIYPNRVAVESETNTTFQLNVKGKNPSLDDFDITPAPGSKAMFSEPKLRQLKKELWNLFLQELTRIEFRRILDEAFDGNCQMAAHKLAVISGKTVSARTVQAWLIEPGKKSSRICPEWALKALKAKLEDPDFREELAVWKQAARRDASSSYAQVAWLEQRDGVRIATNQIDAGERRAQEWKQAGLSTLADMIYKFERESQAHNAFLHDTLFGLIGALKDGAEYPAFRERTLEAVRQISLRDASLKQTRSAIENRTDEFASDDGLPL